MTSRFDVLDIHKNGEDWFSADPPDGRLVTSLMAGMWFGPLESESVITDGHWHHIGLVYDLGDHRRCLYVDGAEVAQDASMVGGVRTEGGLYIGAGKNLEPCSFFSGLIDDFRIYNRAVTP